MYRIFYTEVPEAQIMGVVAILALITNIVSVLLLVQYKDGDANVRSVWLCSRNDAIGNVLVLIAAYVTWQVNSGWPDLVVAMIMTLLFFSSSIQIIRQALAERRKEIQLDHQ